MQLTKISRIISSSGSKENKTIGKKTKPARKNNADNLFLQKLCILEEADRGRIITPAENFFACLLSLLSPGDHLLLFSYSLASHYAALTTALESCDIQLTIVPSSNTEDWEAAVGPQTKMILLQSPTFPLLEVISLQGIARLATKNRLILVVDNSISTPILQTPLSCGADLVTYCYSAWIDGDGKTAAGILLGKNKWLKKLYKELDEEQTAKSNHSLQTYCDALHSAEVRIERQAATAAWLCRKLSYHDKLVKLHYPGIASCAEHSIAKSQMQSGGFSFGIELKGGAQAANCFLRGLQLIQRNEHFGSRSGASHSLSTVPLELQNVEGLPKIPPGLVTLTVGLETREDILEDVLTSLAAC